MSEKRGVYLLDWEIQTADGVEYMSSELSCYSPAAFSLHAKVRDSVGCRYAQLRHLIEEGPSKGCFEQLTTFRA